MTERRMLEQVRDDLREMASGEITESCMITWCGSLADAIDACLTQPAQEVDAKAIRGVVEHMRKWPHGLGGKSRELADTLTHAIGNTQAEGRKVPEATSA